MKEHKDVLIKTRCCFNCLKANRKTRGMLEYTDMQIVSAEAQFV